MLLDLLRDINAIKNDQYTRPVFDSYLHHRPNSDSFGVIWYWYDFIDECTGEVSISEIRNLYYVSRPITISPTYRELGRMNSRLRYYVNQSVCAKDINHIATPRYFLSAGSTTYIDNNCDLMSIIGQLRQLTEVIWVPNVE